MLGFVKHDLLITLYNNPLNKKIQGDIAGLFYNDFGTDIEASERKFNLFLVHSDAISLFSRAAYEVAEVLGVNYYTNPDLVKSTDYTDMFIHQLDCAAVGAKEKLEKILAMKDTNVVVSFKNPEYLGDFSFLNTDVMYGFEAPAVKPEHANIPDTLILERRPAKRAKP